MQNNSDEFINPTPERLAMAGEFVEERTFDNTTRRGYYLLDGNYLVVLRTRKNPMTGAPLLDERQFHAGTEFGRHYDLGFRSPIKSMDLSRDRVDCEGGIDATESRIHFQRKHQTSLASLGHGRIPSVTFELICLGTSIDIVANNWGRSINQKLRRIEITSLFIEGLTNLAAHYWPRETAKKDHSWSDVGSQSTSRPDLRDPILR
jgi:hypothetical protein